MVPTGDSLIRCEGAEAGWSDQLSALWPGIEEGLGLATDFSGIRVCVDESPEEEISWYAFPEGLRPQGGPVPAEFHCCTASLVRRGPRAATFHQPAQVWDGREGAWQGELPPPADFNSGVALAFFNHHFLFLQDLARGLVIPASFSRRQAASFEAAWEVVLDGRLDRAGLAGYSLEERRNRFSRAFSSAGVLMPSHWQIFHSLWEGGLSTQRDVLGVISQLPRL